MPTLKPDDKTELGRAVAAIDGLAEITNRIDELRNHPTPKVTLPADVIEATTLAVIGGAPFPDDVGQRIVKARTEQAEGEAALATRRQIIARLENQADNVTRDGVDQALTALAGSLTDLLSHAAEAVHTLGSIDSADAALKYGNPEQQQAWRQLDNLADRYSSIRTAQMTLVRSAWPDEQHGRVLAAYGEIRGKDTLLSETGGAPPWPHPSENEGVLQIGPALLRWLVTSDAQPWVPTIPELVTEMAEAGNRQSEQDTQRADRLARAKV